MDRVNAQARKEYFNQYIKSWEKELEAYKINKAKIVDEYIADKRLFQYLSGNLRKQAIEEHIELLTLKIEKKLDEIRQEIV